MHIWNTLKRSLELYPERCAVSDGPVSLSYRQVGERVGTLARFLAGRGLAPGDRMSILDWNSHAYLETYYAAALAGAVLNPLNVRLSAREIAFILRDAGSRLLVARDGFAPLVREVLGRGTDLGAVLWVRDAEARTERPREADPGRPAQTLPADVASFRYEDVVCEGGGCPPAAGARRHARRGPPVLHQRDHGPGQGRHAHPRERVPARPGDPRRAAAVRHGRVGALRPHVSPGRCLGHLCPELGRRATRHPAALRAGGRPGHHRAGAGDPHESDPGHAQPHGQEPPAPGSSTSAPCVAS
jgi:hypothetical protein